MQELSSRALQLWMYLQRAEAGKLGLRLRRLHRRNESSTASVVSAGEGPVVSLTSYGERLHSVHLAIESIAAGEVLPSRLILWVDTSEAAERPTPGLARLIRRGLELRLSDNYGPHTKYFPYLQCEADFTQCLVTADDDQIYSRWWLRGLVTAQRIFPDGVNCYRAHAIAPGQQGLAPYDSWKSCHSDRPSFLHFGTGVSGCIYPPALLRRLKAAGTAFREVCPRADDVWLHANAVRAGMKTRQVWSRPLRFPFLPGTQSSGLYHGNVLQSQNDAQIAKTYTGEDLAVLEAAYAAGER